MGDHKNKQAISDYINEFLEMKQMKISTFAKAAGLTPAALTRVMNDAEGTLSIGSLDAITKYMQLPEGHFYEQYIEECFSHKLHWTRMGNLIYRCAEMNRIDCIDQIMQYAQFDNSNQIKNIFSDAESLFDMNMFDAAKTLYKAVVLNEQNARKEYLAISYYRIFLIDRITEHKNLDMSAIQFMPFRDRLPESIALDALIGIGQYFWLRNDPETVKQISEELLKLSHASYYNDAWKGKDFTPDRPLVYYYGQSYLMRAIYYEMIADFKSAMNWHEKYGDLSWFEGLDDKGWYEVERHTRFSKANKLQMAIKLGMKEYIPDYADFLLNNEKEIIHGLESLLASANNFNYNIDDVLGLFSNYLTINMDEITIDEYNKEVIISRVVKFKLEYAIYAFNNNAGNLGVEKLLLSMQAAVLIDDKASLVKSTSLFEIHRKYATSEQIEIYNKTCRRIIYEKENIKIGVGCFGD